MSDFNRRIDERAIAVLKDLAKSDGNWWHDLLSLWSPSGSAGGLRLAIRNGYMNFYSCGQSIAKVSFGPRHNEPMLQVHEKYVTGQSSGGQRYVAFPAHGSKWGGPGTLRSWISNSTGHRGIEKPLIEETICASPQIIDIEMGLPAVGNRKTALRMDIVALEPDRGGARIVFWEAKRLGDSRLRAANHKPEVFEQVDAYREFLSDVGRRKLVTDAYRRTCGLLRDLHTMASTTGDKPSLDPLIIAAADDGTPLPVEETPRLLIFDEGKKRREDAWQRHLKVLEKRVPVAVVAPGGASLQALEEIPRSGG